MANPSQPGARPAVQHEAVDARPILSFVVLVLLGMGLAVWLSTFWFKAENDRVRMHAAMESRYPELERLEVAGRSLLGRYALQPDNSYLIPIDRAIDLLAGEYPTDSLFTSEMP